MRTYFITLITALLLSGAVSAQHVNYGIKGGLNGYKVNFENNAKMDTRLGYHLGFFGHIHLSQRFGLQPELLYSNQGANFEVDGGNNDLSLGYINVPVLFQYMFDNGFRLQAGPQLGLLLHAKAGENDAKNDFNTPEIGLSVGTSYVHPPTGFGVDLRYNHGLSNILDDSAVKATNRGFQFGVFYLFNHGS